MKQNSIKRMTFVPLEKQSKKKRREFYSAQRKDWGGLNPVTRRPENPKAYNRAKSRRTPLDGGIFSLLYRNV